MNRAYIIKDDKYYHHCCITGLSFEFIIILISEKIFKNFKLPLITITIMIFS